MSIFERTWMWLAATVCGAYCAMGAQYAHTLSEISVGEGGEPVGFPVATIVSGLFSLALSAFGVWKNRAPNDASPANGLLNLLLQSLLKLIGVKLTQDENAQVIKWLIDGLTIVNTILSSRLSGVSQQ